MNLSPEIEIERTQSKVLSLFVSLIAMLVGTTLIVSSYFHLTNTGGFLDSILSYRMLPEQVALVFAGTLPYLQCCIGTWLVFGFFQKYSLCCASVLFLIFFVAHLSAMIWTLDVECGCFGPYSQKVSWTTTSLVGGCLFVCLLGALFSKTKKAKSK